MQVNNVSSVSFRAGMPKILKEEMFYSARKVGGDVPGKFLEQYKNFQNWGYATSEIAEVKQKGGKSILALVNSYLAPMKKAELPQKDSLLDTFLSLTERDVINAEYSLKI